MQCSDYLIDVTQIMDVCVRVCACCIVVYNTCEEGGGGGGEGYRACV